MWGDDFQKTIFVIVLLPLIFHVITAPYTLKGSLNIQGFALTRVVLFPVVFFSIRRVNFLNLNHIDSPFI